MADLPTLDLTEFGGAPELDLSEFENPIPESPGIARSLGDTAVAAGSGVLQGGKMLADAAGAGSRVSKALGNAAETVRGFESAQRRAERMNRAEKINQAEQSGSAWEEVKANAGAFAEAPIDTTVEALGASIPTIAAAVLSKGRVSPTAVGAAQGAGTVKGNIYDAVQQEHLQAGASEAEAAARAEQAQAYGGDNQSQIGLGAALGAVAGGTGAESAAARIASPLVGEVAEQGIKPILKSAGAGMLKEAPLEAAQGGQERLASNIALQNEGFDTPTWQGVAGQAALEGLASAPIGGGFGAVEGYANQRANNQSEVDVSEPDSRITQTLSAAPAVPAQTAGEQLPQDVRPPAIDGEPAGPTSSIDAGTQGSALPVRAEAVDPAAGTDSLPPVAVAPAVSAGQAAIETDRARRLKPSEQMGLDPAAGPLSAAAALAVDSGASQPVTPAAEPAIGATVEDIPATGPLTPDAEALLNSVAAGGVPALITKQLRRIAEANGVTISKWSTPQDVVDALAQRRSQVAADTGRPQTRPNPSEQFTDDELVSRLRAQFDAGNRINSVEFAKATGITTERAGRIRARVIQENEKLTADTALTTSFRSVMAANRARRFLDTPDAYFPERQTDGSFRLKPKPESANDAQTVLRPEAAQNPAATAAPDQSAQTVVLETDVAPVATTAAEVSDVAEGAALASSPEEAATTAQNVGTDQPTAATSTAPSDVSPNAPVITADIEAAAHAAATSPRNELPQPTEAQKEAGNYKKGHINLHGLDITIENPRGSTRSGKREDGSTWQHEMSDHYGYVKRTTGADGEQVDVYVGPKPESDRVFIVDQLNQKDGSFDEHKVMLGFGGKIAAVRAYKSNFDKGWKIGPVTSMSMDAFKEWLKGDTSKPVKKSPTTTIENSEDARRGEFVVANGTKAKVLESAQRGQFTVSVNGESYGSFAMSDVGAVSQVKARANWAEDSVRDAAAQFAASQVSAPKAAKPAADVVIDQSADPFANNKLFTADKVAAARARMKSKFGQLNSGIDPEMLIDGMTIAGAYIESGVRNFTQYAARMVDDFGDGVKPYLLSFWEGARNYPGLDTKDMTSAEESAQLHAGLTKGLPQEAAPALGTEVKKPSKRTKKNGGKGDATLTQDWGVDVINGYSDNFERESGNSVKDQYLKDAAKYLGAVADILQEQGFAPHEDAKGRAQKPVSKNEGGVGVSGEVSLTMRHPETGTNVYVHISDTSLRGVVPMTPSGITVMYRVSSKAGDTYATKGTNRWSPVDLSAADLAGIIAKEAGGVAPELKREAVEQTSGDRPASGADSGADAEGIGAERVQPPEDGGQAAGSTGRTDVSLPAGGRGRPAVGAEPAGNVDSAGQNAADEQRLSGSGRDGAESGSRANYRNYRIRPGELKREGSWFATAERNIQIVELVKAITAEGRQATPDEKALLTKFTGWGASEIANGLFPAKDGQYSADRWQALAERLQAALTPEEYAQAKRTTQYAHYTSEPIIRSVYSALERLGFNGGQILEPGMGVGLFNGLMPDGMATGSTYTGIEYDTITGNIAALLYPESNMIVGDFTKTKLPRDYFDAAIGNPPFGQIKIQNDPEYRKQGFLLHDYFFAKTIDRVKPGGLLVFVTSAGTMNKASDRARAYLAERADLLGAVRLPQTAFKDNAGTEVVTDVIFLRKRAEGEAPAGQAWLSLKEVSTPQGPTQINEYFADHPEMVLGRHALTGSMYRANTYTVEPIEGDIEQLFAKAVENLPENIYRPVRGSAAERAVVQRRDYDPKIRKEGGVYVADDGTLMQVESGSGVPITGRRGSNNKEIELKPRDVAWLKGYVGLRDALKQAQYDQLNDGDWETSLAALQQRYDAFVKQFGPILKHSVIEREQDDGTVLTTRRFTNDPLLRIDAEGALAYALENITPTGEIEKAPVLLKRTLNKPAAAQITNVRDAMFVSLDQLGHFDLAHVAELAGKTEAETIEDLGDAIYQMPGGGAWTTADDYLSGNVVRKLREAELAARTDKRYQRNVTALEAVQPRALAPQDITVQMGAGWIPASDVRAFVSEVMGEELDISYNPATADWHVGESATERGVSEWGTKDRKPNQLLESILNNRQIKVVRYDAERKPHTDPEATEQANEVARKIRMEFRRWIWTDDERTGRLVTFYNEHFNNIAPRSFDGSHLTLPGVSSLFSLRSHQKRAIWRTIQQGDVYYNHAVGAGKTFTMIAAGMEERRLGLVKKPMYVVPNHMLAQFSKEFLELYPAANIMVADEHNFHTHNRRRFIAQAALNDPDAIIITHSAFGKLPMSEEYSTAFLQKQINDWQAALDDTGESDRVTRKQIERRIEQLENRLEKLRNDDVKDKVLNFEEMGVDRLYVDEGHEFRKLDYATNQGSVKGIDSSGSQKAMDLYMKTTYLREKHPGRALVMASGTAVTNTMGELFTVQRFFQPEQLEEDNHEAFDAWASHYGEIVAGLEQNAAGGYETVSRFAKFVNVPELMARVRGFMDILTSDQLGDLVVRPDIEEGGRQVVVTPSPAGYKEYQKELERRIKEIRDRKGPPKKGDDIILKVIADGRFSAIDMRFVDSQLPSDPESKLNRVIADMVDAYHETKDWEYHTKGEVDPDRGATMMLFTDIGLGEQSAESRGFDMKDWIRERLIAGGVDPNHIAFMRDHKAHAKKERLFEDMRQGRKRILIGGKDMETGVNAQKRLHDLFHLDCPWFPASVEQREGRILRQGNQNKTIRIRGYAAKGSYDSTMWGMNARKARFIEQAMRGDASMRNMEDVSEASQFEMAAALASGDERYLKLAGLKGDVERLGRLYSAHTNEQRDLKGKAISYEHHIRTGERLIADVKAALQKRVRIEAGAFSGVVDGQTFDNREEFSNALWAQFKHLGETAEEGERTLGVLGGFDIVFSGKMFRGTDFGASLELDTPGGGGLLLVWPPDAEYLPKTVATRAANIVNRLDDRLMSVEDQVRTDRESLEKVQRRIGKAFPEMAEYIEKTEELGALEAELAAESKPAEADAAAAMVEIERIPARVSRPHAGGQTIETALSSIAENQGIYSGYERETRNLQVEQRRRPDAEKSGQLDLLAPAAVPATIAADQARDNFTIRYVQAPVGTVRVGVDTVTTAEEAAHVFSAFRKHAQETMLALVTGNDGKILNLIRHTKGLKDASQASPVELVAAAVATDGAANLWLAHNHPSGLATPSTADIRLTDTIERVMDGAGLKLKGHIILGDSGRAKWFEAGIEGEDSIQVSPRLRKRSIDITERVLRRRSKPLAAAVTSPANAKTLINSISAPNAVVLLDTQNVPVGVVAMTMQEMASLRTTAQIPRLFRALDTTNAGAVIIKSESQDAAINIARFFSRIGQIRVLDAFTNGSGSYVSDAESQGIITMSSGPFLDISTGAAPRSTVLQLRRALAEKFGARPVQNLIDRGLLSVVPTFDALPDSIKAGILRQGVNKSAVRGSHDPKTGRVFLIADRVEPARAATMLLHEIGEHYGLERMLGKEGYARLQDDVRQLRMSDPIIAEAWETTAKRYPHLDKGGKRFVREVIARLADDPRILDASWFQRVLIALRRFLWQMGLRRNLTADDMRGMMAASLRRVMNESGPAVASSRLAPAAADMGAEIDLDIDAIANAHPPKNGGSIFQSAKRAISDSNANWRGQWLKALTRQQIVDIGKDVLPQTKKFEQLARAMDADGNAENQMYQPIAEKWSEWANGVNKIKQAAAGRMAGIMHDATNAGVDPDKPRPVVTSDMGIDRREKVRARQAAWDQLRPRFEALPAELQQVYRDVRDAYTVRRNDMMKALASRIDDSELTDNAKRLMQDRLRLAFESNEIDGPYFPLARFGDFYIVAEKNGQRHYAMFETVQQRRESLLELQKDGWTIIGQGKSIKNLASDLGPSASFMTDALALIDEKSGGEASMALKDGLWQMYLQSLPEASIRKHFIHRTGTPGFSKDALRAFASQMAHGSKQIARLRFGYQLADTLQDMKKKAVTSPDPDKAADIIKALDSSYQWMMNPNGATWANRATSIGFLWYLGVSPAAAAVNLLQTPMVTLPVIGAKYGFTKAAGALAKAGNDYLGYRFNKDKKAALEQEYAGDMGKMLDELDESGAIDRTQTMSLMGMSEDNSTVNLTAEKWMKKIGYLFHQAERLNREATAIAVYRLAREKGDTHKQAVTSAYDAIFESHFDYGSGNRAELMRSNAAKVLLLFKQYSQNMTYLLWRNAYQMFKGADAATRAEARKKLMGITGMTFAMSGAMGMPMASTAFWIADLIAGMFGDDDEPWDSELAFRNFLADFLGETGGSIVARGVANESGLDIASRVGLGELWIRSPGRDLEGRALALHYLEQAAGPVAGIGINAIQGLDTMSQPDQFWRGAESLVPKFVRDAMKMVRYAGEGVTNQRGDVVVAQEELGVVPLFFQASGLAPAAVSERWEQNNQLKRVEQRIMDRRKYLVNLWYAAHQAGDTEMKTEAMQRIQSFNQKNRDAAITGQTLQRSLRARLMHSRKAQDGIQVNPKLRPRLDDLRYLEEGA